MKRQNLRVDLAVEVGKIVQAGLLVTCGMIVGFDHDDAGIFERQARFISRLPTPLMQLNVLVAPPSTPLYARLKAEGRILEGEERPSGSLLKTNIIPKSITGAQLTAGMKWLINQVYSPSAFWGRLEAFAEHCSLHGTPPRAPALYLRARRAGSSASYGTAEGATSGFGAKHPAITHILLSSASRIRAHRSMGPPPGSPVGSPHGCIGAENNLPLKADIIERLLDVGTDGAAQEV
jgi:hypothetical protein